MGYLNDNTPDSRFWVICPDIYPYRIIVDPGFASNLELSTIVKDVLPDVEDWQFSGRRYCPQPRRKQPRVIHPARYAQNSRKMRPRVERVVYAFHDTLQRQSVANRLTNLGFSIKLENDASGRGGELFVVL
jgi:hypothetical protein